MARVAKEIWVIFDPLDGPHLFTSEKKAWKVYTEWEKEAQEAEMSADSFWDMSQPTRYVIGRTSKCKK